MKNTTFLSDGQCLKGMVVGLHVDSELRVLDPNKAAERKVYDREKDQRRPCLIRIQNVGTVPVFWSEGLGLCNAEQWNGVMPKDTTGGATPDGDGGTLEWRTHIPHDIYVYAGAAAAVRVTIRYAE